MTDATLAPPDRELDDVARMSTAPREHDEDGPPSTWRGRSFRPLRDAWRTLTSMRTALLLLFLLALAAIPGSLLPQTRTNPVTVSDYARAHPRAAPWLARFDLFDVYGSPWFAAVYLLLAVSLVGCLVPRLRLHARALRTPPPPAPRHLDRLPQSTSYAVDDDPQRALERARAVLSGARYRVVSRAPDTLSAEKGYLRETGNLVFHLAVLGLLAAIAANALVGYQGTILLTEGQGFANTPSSYDDYKPGRFTTATDLAPVALTLEKFSATYLPSGQPASFNAAVSWTARPGDAPRPADIQVNSPLDIGGVRFFLQGHGYSPRVRVTGADGQVAFDGTVPCLPVVPATLQSRCVVKVPDARPEALAFQGMLFPDLREVPGTGARIPQGPQLGTPALALVAYRGDLGLDSGLPQSVYQLPAGALESGRLARIDAPAGAAAPGVDPSSQAFLLQTGPPLALPGGGSIQLLGVSQWATFTVADKPGQWTLLVAAVALIGGLLLSLRVRRRRVWIRVSAGDSTSGPAVPASGAAIPASGQPATRRTVVTVGGLARTDADTFAEEFAGLTSRLAVPPTPREE